jgi:hypothetical protein
VRDQHDYESMTIEELRGHLVRVSKELASWLYASETAKRDHNAAYNEALGLGYKNVSEARANAEIQSGMAQREVHTAEAHVQFYRTIRDLISALIDEQVITRDLATLTG